MTEEQFTQLISKIDSLYMMLFVGIICVIFGLGVISGGQR